MAKATMVLVSKDEVIREPFISSGHAADEVKVENVPSVTEPTPTVSEVPQVVAEKPLKGPFGTRIGSQPCLIWSAMIQINGPATVEKIASVAGLTPKRIMEHMVWWTTNRPGSEQRKRLKMIVDNGVILWQLLPA